MVWYGGVLIWLKLQFGIVVSDGGVLIWLILQFEKMLWDRDVLKVACQNPLIQVSPTIINENYRKQIQNLSQLIKMLELSLSAIGIFLFFAFGKF